MKITALLLFVACLQVYASGHGQGISISEKDVPITKIFNQISKQAGYHFLFNDQDMELAKKVSLEVKGASLEETLKKCFQEQPLEYSIKGKTIIVTRKRASNGSKNNTVATAKLIDITGRVTDNKGNPLAGANVKIRGSSKGTTCNDVGIFALDNVDEKAVLEISFVGFETRLLSVRGEKYLSISLNPGNSVLDETVVIAYGTTSKRLNTGNISSVKAQDIQRQPVNNPLLALQGRVPGLFITQNSGVPGGGLTVRIQGQNSLSRGNDPLYVVDGVPFVSQLLPNLGGTGGILGSNGNTSNTPGGGGNPLSFLNPSDIESIEVLKDADATSIYGSRAAAGAILITTRKGRSGKTQVDLNVQHGLGQVARTMDLLNTTQYLEMRKEAYFTNDQLTENSPQYATSYDINGTWDLNRYTDWQKELIGGTARYTDAHVSVSGGNANTHFLVGLGYHRETTVFPGSLDDQKGSAQININHSSANQKFRLQFSNTYLADQNRLIRQDFTTLALRLAPNAPALHNPDGSLNWATLSNGNSTWYNPLAYLEEKYDYKVNNLISNITVGYQLLDQLTIKSSFGYSNLRSNEVMTLPLSANAPDLRTTSQRSASFSNGNISSYIIEPQLVYKRDVLKGKLEVLTGLTFQTNRSYLQGLTATGHNSDHTLKDIRSGASVAVDNSIESVYKYSAFFGRLNYNWDDKYILNFTGRRDGSSRFGSENLFHNFGSVAGAWNFSNEQFMKDGLSWLSFGKVRVSYGTTGNDQIGDYQFMNLFNPVAFPNNYQLTTGLTPAGLSNPYLQWEETRKLQGGLDLGFFDGRIILNTTYFRNRSSNQLQSYALPLITGFNNIQTNFPALVQNSGIELLLNTVNIKSSSFTWSSSINATFSRNKIIDYPNLDASNNKYLYVVGEPIPVSRGFKFAGVDASTGLFTFYDANGNATSSPVPPIDQLAINVGFPTLYGGFQNNIRYKGFELDFLIQFVKQDAPNYRFGTFPGRFLSSNDRTESVVANQPVNVLNRWRKAGENADFQRFSSDYPMEIMDAYSNARVSDGSFSDASFVRVKNVSLSWDIPAVWSRTMKLSSMRVFMRGQNILTFTDYIGLDPESQSITNLPPLRTVVFGLNIIL